jgi:hypothetical protein
MIMLAFSRFRRSPSSRCPDASSASRRSFPIRRRSRCKRDCAAPATAWNAERRRSEPFTAQVMAAINDARPLAADDRAMIKASATALAEYFRHIPKIVVFRATVLIQFARLLTIPDRIQIRREGTISPRPSRRSARCPARRLRHAQHDVPSLPAGAAQGPARSRTQSHRVFAVNSSRGADPRPCRLRRHLRSERGLFCDRLQIRYNLEGYFFAEGEGRKLAQVRNDRSLTVVAAVGPSGRAPLNG